jgi:hypothetical protein
VGTGSITSPFEWYDFYLYRQRLVRRYASAVGDCLVAATGDIYFGLWYPIIVALTTLVIGTLFLRETKERDIRSDVDYKLQTADISH